MPNFRNFQNEAQQYGQRADLDSLTRRVSQLESEIQELRTTLHQLIQKIENPQDEPQE